MDESYNHMLRLVRESILLECCSMFYLLTLCAENLTNFQLWQKERREQHRLAALLCKYFYIAQK